MGRIVSAIFIVLLLATLFVAAARAGEAPSSTEALAGRINETHSGGAP